MTHIDKMIPDMFKNKETIIINHRVIIIKRYLSNLKRKTILYNLIKNIINKLISSIKIHSNKITSKLMLNLTKIKIRMKLISQIKLKLP